ncbi:cellulose binding domain-containing protein [Paractinoplanes rishiriensis]|uniref:CBM2 domain-containing protein n=1 Tax=Paractinoplanes rishiriensis TaxID=1050105 RepID=A0A919N053_9ACTN|nr:hypothetical protein Ari01nite_95790 [Actinoplanes rishiriensis]
MSRRRPVLGAIAAAAVLALAAGGALVSGGLGGSASAAEAGTLAASGGCGKAPTLASGIRTITSNVDYNGRIAAGQSTEFGFQATGSGSGLTPT